MIYSFYCQPTLTVDLGFYRNHDGEVKLAIEIGGGIEARFVKTVGVVNLWRQSIAIARDLQPGMTTETDPDQYWEGANGGECFDIKTIGDVVYSPGDSNKQKRCKYMLEAYELTTKTENSNPRCSTASMVKRMGNEWWLKKNNHVAVECIQQWHGVRDKINKLIKKYHKAKNLQVDNKVGKTILNLGYKLKINELHQKIKIPTVLIIAGIFAAAGKDIPGSPPANLGSSGKSFYSR